MTDLQEMVDSIVYGALDDYIAEVRNSFVKTAMKEGTLGMEDAESLRHLPELSRRVAEDVLSRYALVIPAETRLIVESYLAELDDDLTRLLPWTRGRGLLSDVWARNHISAVSDTLAKTVKDSTVMATDSMVGEWTDAYVTASAKYAAGGKYEDVMSEAVSRFVEEGTKVYPQVSYRSGRRMDVDAAVRMHVMTQTNRGAMSLTERRCLDAGITRVQVSQHFGARPSHAVWQGGVYELGGELERVTGYGRVDGLAGVNCAHYMTPYIDGLTQPPEMHDTYTGMTSGEFYAFTQRQRAREREIRKLRQEYNLGRRNGLDMTDTGLKLKEKERRWRALGKKHGLEPDSRRVMAFGT